jgi:hypothetical protein
MDLEHMADSAKRICGMAPSIRQPSESLVQLTQLAKKKAGECFRTLHKLDLVDVTMILSTSAGRAEHEAVFERVVAELEGLGELLSPRELEPDTEADIERARSQEVAARMAALDTGEVELLRGSRETTCLGGRN